MKPSARRVAARHLRTAGIFEVPPRMFETIRSWVRAQVAANAIPDKQRMIEKLRGYRTLPIVRERFGPLQAAIEGIRSDPTSWKAYVALYDASWAFGHPGIRLSVKEFQKLTPERKAALAVRMLELASGLEERMEADFARSEADVGKYVAEKARLESIAAEWPGIQPESSPKIVKLFPLDLTGWKYGEERIRQGLAKRLVKWEQWLAEAPTPQAREMIQDVMNRVREAWGSIRVELVTNIEVKEAAAFWREGDKLIQIRVPYAADDWQLERLAQTLRHEMQHMAQSLLTYALTNADDMAADLKRRPGPGMPSRHIMTPDYLQQLAPGRLDPASLPPEARALVQRFRQQGLNLHDLHSLDDIEFYTKLADLIDDTKRLMDRVGDLTADERLDVVRFVTWQIDADELIKRLGGYERAQGFSLSGPSHFLRALRTAAPGKWRKAVAELTKALL